MGLWDKRSQKRLQQKPGLIRVEGKGVSPSGSGQVPGGKQMFRSPRLERILKHIEDRNYDHLMDWREAVKSEEWVPVHDRKPFVRMNVPKLLAVRLSSKLHGKEVFPVLNVSDDEEAQEYFRAIIKAAGLDFRLVGPMRQWVSLGSVFIHFHFVDAKIRLHAYCSNDCFPEFNPDGELDRVSVKYVYTDNDDLDSKGVPKRKWYKAEFTTTQDILYDNPEFKADAEPVFQVVESVEHGFGFVQGEWMRTSEEDLATPDGFSLVEDALPFVDAMNYSLSLSQEATDYNTSPQLGISGLDSDGVDDLIRSSTKAWNLGREGKAGFIEGDMSGVERSIALRDKNRLFIQDLTRVILMDPEKMTASAQSGKALEILHGPMVDLINELRPQLESHILSLIIKLGVANILMNRVNPNAPVPIPPGWAPQSFNLTIDWPPIFPMTVKDMKEFTDWVSSAVNGNLISRKTGVKKVAKYFGVEDVEAELYDIENQKSLSPFGMF